jgi:hypothetical protein
MYKRERRAIKWGRKKWIWGIRNRKTPWSLPFPANNAIRKPDVSSHVCVGKPAKRKCKQKKQSQEEAEQIYNGNLTRFGMPSQVKSSRILLGWDVLGRVG